MTTLEVGRRGLLRAALFLAAAPVIVKASSLMPIRAPKLELLPYTAPSEALVALQDEIHADVVRSLGLDNIRMLLLPGIRGIEGRYKTMPSQHERSFNT